MGSSTDARHAPAPLVQPGEPRPQAGVGRRGAVRAPSPRARPAGAPAHILAAGRAPRRQCLRDPFLQGPARGLPISRGPGLRARDASASEAAAPERGGARAPRASSRVRFRSQATTAPDRCPLGAQVRRRSSAPRDPARLRAPAAAVRRHVGARSRALRTSGSRRGRAHVRACAPGGAGRGARGLPEGQGLRRGPWRPSCAVRANGPRSSPGLGQVGWATSLCS